MNQTVFNEVEGNVLEIFVERNLEGDLHEFEFVEGISVWGHLLVTAWIFYNLLNVSERSIQVVCTGKDHFVHLFVIKAYAEI